MARRRWLAEVGHELRTPFSAIRGELDALEDGVRPFDPAAVVSLNEEAKRLSGLIEDLHFLSLSDRSRAWREHRSRTIAAWWSHYSNRFAARGGGVSARIVFVVEDDPKIVAVLADYLRALDMKRASSLTDVRWSRRYGLRRRQR
jgi:signal transduction histidine kinase